MTPNPARLVVLGPCPCQGCGELVWWARALGWLDRHGLLHKCPAEKAA